MPSSLRPFLPVLFIAGHTPGSEFMEVWRDGRREPLAIRADSIDGWVERYVSGPDGKIATFLGKPRAERVYGKVEIKSH